MTTRKCLLIDSYGFIFRAFHVQPPLTSPEGKPVGAIYGFASMLIKLLQEHNPTHVAAVFDTGGKNFRHDLFSDYKAHRLEVPADLIAQFPMMRDVAAAFNLKALELNGYEADDVIATLAKKLASEDEEVIIVSADKDLAQLMNGKIKIFDPTKNKFISEVDIEEKFGVGPDRIRDVLALIGDKSDNIPGVPGFGPKTASELINKFGSFDKLIENYSQIESGRKREIFRENIEKAKLSYDLVELKSDLNLGVEASDLLWAKADINKLQSFLSSLGFKSLLGRVSKISNQVQAEFQLGPIQTKANSSAENVDISSNLDDISGSAISCGYISLLNENENILIESHGKLFRISNISQIEKLLQDDSILKILYNVKEWGAVRELRSYADISIMAYVLSAGLTQSDLSGLVSRYTQEATSDAVALCKNMKKLHDILQAELYREKSLSLYLDIDLPISKILNGIEKAGVKFDVELLNKLSQEFEVILAELQEKIFVIAGMRFNIGSPKQLGEVLFEHLKLPTGSKNVKTQTYSTNAEVLELLQEKGFEIADHLLKWRQISKLKNTYTDSLPKMVNEKTGRIHTTLLQTSTSTGRLSSTEPNLQNIPIRTIEGAKIRSAIIASEGKRLISADYSQVELRILAEIADILELKQAFLNDQDVHSKTAAQIFNIDINTVTSEQRRKAKAINFGIIYGISSFGLAKQLGISRIEAKEYIEKYFIAYPGIEAYMQRTKEFAEKNGFVENYFGRKCFIPQINSSNHAMKNFGERAAVNAPIQGAASDIVKIAMIEVDRMLRENNFQTKMILQIHDELLFEAMDDEVEKVIPLIKKSMENVVKFSVKLRVDISANF